MADRIATTRLAWPDAGRGLAIVLVVLLHAEMMLSVPDDAPRALHVFDEAVRVLRMPLFFTIAGLFAHKWVAGGWTTLWSGKISLLYWVYLVWSLLWVPLRVFSRTQVTGDELDVGSLAISAALIPVRADTIIWFLWTLCLFFIAAKAIRRLPVGFQLGTAAAIAIVYTSLPNGAVAFLTQTTGYGYTGFASYFVFFLVGLHGRSLIMRFAQSSLLLRTTALAIGGLALLIKLALILHILDPGLQALPGLQFALECAALPAGIALATFLARLTPLVHIGSRTLPVYVSHGFTFVAIAWIVKIATASDGLPEFGVPAMLLGTVLAVLVGLALGRVTQTRLSWLLVQPRWFARSRERAPEPAVVTG
ncbi:acyltransferase family protein [Demequina iriomotensis]|uniref:acyltransferase family protein n=1 Tax=Demequina iriomotensis TaxID=1536641 RepID=UPI000AE74EB3|nr:acyltransferase [Demequina iriomotensis]